MVFNSGRVFFSAAFLGLAFLVLNADAMFEPKLFRQCFQDVQRNRIMNKLAKSKHKLVQTQKELDSFGFLRSIGSWLSSNMSSREQLQQCTVSLKAKIKRLEKQLLACEKPDVVVEIKSSKAEGAEKQSLIKLGQPSSRSVLMHTKNKQGCYDTIAIDVERLLNLVIPRGSVNQTITEPLVVQRLRSMLNNQQYHAFAFYTRKSLQVQDLQYTTGSSLAQSASSNSVQAIKMKPFNVLHNALSNNAVVVDLVQPDFHQHSTVLKSTSGKPVLSLEYKKQFLVKKLKKIQQRVELTNRVAQKSGRVQPLIANSQKQRSASSGVPLDRFKTMTKLNLLRALRRKKERIIKRPSNNESVVARRFVAPFFKSLSTRSIGRVSHVQQKIKEEVNILNKKIEDTELELLQIDNPDIILEYISNDDSQSVDLLESNIDNKQLIHTKKNTGKIVLHIKNVNGLYNSIELNLEQLSTKYNAIFKLIKERWGSRLGFYLRYKQAQSNFLGSSKSRDNLGHFLNLLKQKKLFRIELCELACKICLDSADKAKEPSFLTGAEPIVNDNKVFKNVNYRKGFEQKTKVKQSQIKKTSKPKQVVLSKLKINKRQTRQFQVGLSKKTAQSKITILPKKEQKRIQQQVKKSVPKKQTQAAASLLQQAGASQAVNGNSCDASTSSPQSKMSKPLTPLQLFLQRYGLAIIKTIQDCVGVDPTIVAQAKEHVRFFGGMLAAYNRQSQLVSDLGDQANSCVLAGQQSIGQAVLKMIAQNMKPISRYTCEN